jgi:ribosomal protein L19
MKDLLLIEFYKINKTGGKRETPIRNKNTLVGFFNPDKYYVKRQIFKGRCFRSKNKGYGSTVSVKSVTGRTRVKACIPVYAPQTLGIKK